MAKARSKKTTKQRPKSAAKRIKLDSAAIVARLKKIKLLALDVDGVMTDGQIFWLDGFGWTRHFHVKDGYGLKLLMKAGIQVAVISGGDSKDVRHRMEFLKIPYIFLGDENKIVAYEKIKQASGLQDDQMAFMGDELFDTPVFDRVGFSATVPHAVDAVKQRADYITETPGGWGAVREVADAIRLAQGLEP